MLNKNIIVVKIGGMRCAACARLLEKMLRQLDGIISVNVNFATEKAVIEYDLGKINLEKIYSVIREAGYEPLTEGNVREISIKIDDMNCASCAMRIEKALKSINGVKSATVNFAVKTATVKYDPNIISILDLRKAITDLGYTVVSEEEVDESIEEMRNTRLRMVIVWLCTIPIIVWMIPEMIFGLVWPSKFVYDLALILFAIPALFWAGLPTLKSALKAIAHKTANMDVLIMIGTLIAFLTGPLFFFTSIFNYSGISAMIISFHLTGRYFEANAKGKASQAIRQLLKLEAKTARILINGEEREIPIQEVKIGNMMTIRPGEKVSNLKNNHPKMNY
ncbi:MAG: hypothetical protein DRJ30_05140 [Candidatus Methanomethylicota archaeon]|nr:MAG: hypothetical protein DRJ30_05140 [Candidatus Verstraetearchaeota archaeon]